MITPKEVADKLTVRLGGKSVQYHLDNPSYLTGTWDFCAVGSSGFFKFRLDEMFLRQQDWGYGFPKCKLEQEILLTTIANKIKSRLARAAFSAYVG